MKIELRQILENSSMGVKETEAVYTELLNLFSVSPSFNKEDLGQVYQIGFNHGKHVAPFQKDRIVEAFCDADNLNKNINWE